MQKVINFLGLKYDQEALNNAIIDSEFGCMLKKELTGTMIPGHKYNYKKVFGHKHCVSYDKNDFYVHLLLGVRIKYIQQLNHTELHYLNHLKLNYGSRHSNFCLITEC